MTVKTLAERVRSALARGDNYDLSIEADEIGRAYLTALDRAEKAEAERNVYETLIDRIRCDIATFSYDRRVTCDDYIASSANSSTSPCGNCGCDRDDHAGEKK